MSYKKYFSYVRVSSQRQGQMGTSLGEQLSAIENYARRLDMNIVRRFEERETAAKTGRPVFSEMLHELKRGGADGIIIHKIDRGARNLKDWAELGALIDLGVEVHFANESVDLNSRGGRLSADIQAVVAADFIRNLREESRKGIRGRLKQGLYPFPARVGYLDAGKGNPKKIDPVQGPLVAKAFELYSKGDIGLDALVDKMFSLGLRNKNGRKVSRNGLVCVLKNPFYFGVVRMRGTGAMYPGKHRPVIGKKLFDDVQAVFSGRNSKKSSRHFFLFRKLVTCNRCGNALIAEKQKGHHYYRCHRTACAQKTIREELIEAELLKELQGIRFNAAELKYFAQVIAAYEKTQPQRAESMEEELRRRLESLEGRFDRIVDAYVDGVLDEEIYIRKKNQIVTQRVELEDQLRELSTDAGEPALFVRNFLELANRAYLSYKLGMPEEKRELVRIITSNLAVEGKSVSIKLKKPFQLVAKREKFPAGRARRATSRTITALLKQLLKFFDEMTGELEDNDLGLAS